MIGFISKWTFRIIIAPILLFSLIVNWYNKKTEKADKPKGGTDER